MNCLSKRDKLGLVPVSANDSAVAQVWNFCVKGEARTRGIRVGACGGEVKGGRLRARGLLRMSILARRNGGIIWKEDVR